MQAVASAVAKAFAAASNGKTNAVASAKASALAIDIQQVMLHQLCVMLDQYAAPIICLALVVTSTFTGWMAMQALLHAW